ncbi:protein kinase domain-containing protein [Spirosoma fluviale]|uniref:Serine/threonine protein kinase n=1 Tax=Spirosoma fluviale TaxID=1597977 RepID=A0A286GM15_9BACT|nr:protein kinase [Spirosoma fluviale]SOD96129.1 Serine/threonine protein kinase [Spirosoma fluviale]
MLQDYIPDEKFNFHKLNNTYKEILLEGFFGRGECTFHTSGMCGEIFLFDYGANSFPRHTCIKLPKPIAGVSKEESARRFVRELELQLSFYHNRFVHWAFDFDSFFDIPIASFKYWGNDLANLIRTAQLSQVSKYSLLFYICIGLRHCYRRGLIAHQDLKPANIFIQNIKNDVVGLPNLDIYDFAIIADFGLANASIDCGIYDGSRPYMAPEQWKKLRLTQATDVFALGVIFYELITNGYHPVGIKLSDFWPKAQHGNSGKWTKKDKWEKWIKNDCKIELLEDGVSINETVFKFIKRMLSVEPSLRPSIDDTIQFLLNQINDISTESCFQLKFLVNHFEVESSKTSDLQVDWPDLFKKWKEFKERFK